MTTATATPETDEFLRVLQEKQRKHAETGAVLQEPQERKRAALAIASDAAEAQRQKAGPRAELVIKAGMDPSAYDELAQIDAEIAALAQRESHAREAAERFTAEIAALAPAHHANGRALIEAQFAIVQRDHQVAGVRVREAFFTLQSELTAWLASARHYDEQRRAVHGEHIRADNDGPFRLMRAWTSWSRDLFGRLVGRERLDTLSTHFGPDSGNLD